MKQAMWKVSMVFVLVVLAGISAPAWSFDSAVKEVRGPTWKTVPESTSSDSRVLQSIKFKAPLKGFVTVTVTGTVTYDHTFGTAGSYCLDLANTAEYVGGCTPMVGSDSATRNYIPADFPTTTEGFGTSSSYSIVRTWPVSKDQEYNFYLNGIQTNLDKVLLFHPTMTAVFSRDALR